MKRLIMMLLLGASLLTAAPVMAQSPANDAPAAQAADNELPVKLEIPNGWTIKNLPEGDKRFVVYEDTNTASSIEVLGKQLIRAEHAQTLFKAFDGQLVNVGFVKNNAATTDKTFKLTDGSNRTGSWYAYSYQKGAVAVQVSAYIFTVKNFAVIVVGYFSAAEEETGIKQMETLIQNMVEIDKPTPLV